MDIKKENENNGFWAKFRYGGRSAHYFCNNNASFTLCGKMPFIGNLSVYEESSLKGRQCSICKKNLKKQIKGGDC